VWRYKDWGADGGDKVGLYRVMIYEMVYESVTSYGSYSKIKVDEL